MKNPFKEIETKKEAPKELKKTIMKEVAVTKLIVEMGELFSLNYISIFENTFNSKKKPQL